MSLVRRGRRSLPQLTGADADGEVSLIVLDTEGLAYCTNLSRHLMWVTRLTDNLLNVKKPYVETPNNVCALNNAPTRGMGWDREKYEEHTTADSQNGKAFKTCGRNAGAKAKCARHLVPSYDGYVYCIYETGHSQLLHIHVRDIVNFTPFRTPLLDGVYLEGSRNSSVMALDFHTGSYIARNLHDVHYKTHPPASPDQPERETQRQLHIGYTDWTVRAFDEKSHVELWSFNWREIGAVNSENVGPVVVERVREIIKVQGQKLAIDFEDDEGKISEEMNFPFPIAAVFAVLWNANEEIMTLQIVERISIPPPAAFLQNALDKAYGSIKLSSSSYFGRNLVSVKGGVINVKNMWDPEVDGEAANDGGRLITIKMVDKNHYYTLDTGLQPLTFTQQNHTKWQIVKWWCVLTCWLLTFALAPLMNVLRILKECIDRKIYHRRWWAKMPFSRFLLGQVSLMIDDFERGIFESTERLIYNVDRISPLHSVDNVCQTFTVPLKLINNTDEMLEIQRQENRSQAGSAAQSARSEESEGHELPRVELAVETSEINYSDDEMTREDELRAISVVPAATALANFLENGRFLRTFDCIKLLGKGGFGSVYRAQHKLEPGHPTYAIKLVLLKLKASEGLTSRRYFREIVANREISSKYVVRYFTWWCEEPHFLPLTQLTPEIQSAAANNVKHLVGSNSLNTQRAKALNGFMQHYQEMLRGILEKRSDEDYPSFSNVAFNNSLLDERGRVGRRVRLAAIGEQTGGSQLNTDEDDSMLNGVCAFEFEDDNYEHDGRYPNVPQSESSQGIVFEYSNTSRAPAVGFDGESPRENSENSDDGDAEESGNCHQARVRDTEKQYPVVLLILMELCKGFTLREWLNRPGRSDKPMQYTLSPNGVPVEFDLFRQLIKGLRDIHANNFIHRDLKPENVFVDPNTNALKIGDFGLVGFISQSTRETRDTPPPEATAQQDSCESSLPGQLIGTPGYAAPEGGFNCSEKADIFSAALILLELLSPRFHTVMERFTVLENFRNTGRVPEFIEQELSPWHRLLTEMADRVPQRRPSAVEVQKKLKGLIAMWCNEPAD
ncbi:PK4 protein kinase, putative [Babesia bigemina]|uniref:non-specific serine/threonine protein kinase n=1 Tax=Babesia bigemina TaxID=5866 RepID=A0A061D1G9_BABBI|nr:PK4 protein kinase, putative [Babesia bigemina]CDR94646.1 PK4 protein kinase, putative [Babesia bigemina]|eukprot:XP_012766832.1 PK4 protein kinase, putative [Babesia bigemina]